MATVLLVSPNCCHSIWHVQVLLAHLVRQVQNLHSCVQVINDFVSPEHVTNSFHLTQQLRPNHEEVNYEDKLQVNMSKELVGQLMKLILFEIFSPACR